MTVDVIPIPALKDNYIWLLRRAGVAQCAVVDPGDARPVLDYLRAEKLELSAVLITHHHPDHTAGLPGLQQSFPACTVYGPAREGPAGIAHRLAGGMRVRLGELQMEFSVLDIPGHTLGHIAYYCDAESLLFCGDTLFAAGCGRLFEGTAAQMYDSLRKLAALPGTAALHCGHEYTLRNIAFAREVEPRNDVMESYAHRAARLLEARKPTLPTRLCDELAVNPFLRAHLPQVRAAAERHVGETLPTPVEVFGALRLWKDSF